MLRTIALIPLALVAGCASAPESTVERVAVATAEAGPPTCNAARHTALADGVVTIRPGQTICVTLEATGSSVSPVAVVSVVDPGRTLILRSWQEPGRDDVFLSVHNPLSGLLKYRAGMRLPGERGYRATSSCPVLSERFSLEHWPHSITELVLTDFRILPGSDDSMVCE